MKGKYNKEACVSLLTEKQRALNEESISRYPQRSDFGDEEVCAIKAFLGPWPRALEAAGLNPARNDDRPKRNAEKRIRAKRRRTEALKLSAKTPKSGNAAEAPDKPED